MSDHPLDLHPLHEVAQAAWNKVKQDHQPEFVELPIDYRSRLLSHAENVKAGKLSEGHDTDPIVQFEQEVARLEAPATEASDEQVDESTEELDEAGGEDGEGEESDESESTDDSADDDEADSEPLEPKGKLPSDFPAHDKLHEAGVNTYTQLSKVEDLTEIAGIGPATVKEIKKRVRADTRALNKK